MFIDAKTATQNTEKLWKNYEQIFLICINYIPKR